MTQPADNPSLFAKIRNKFRHGLVFLVIRDYLMKIKIEITPFYWMKETIPDQIPVQLGAELEGCEFSLFGLEEIQIICRLPERKHINEKNVLKRFQEGKKCYGVKYKGEIAAFTWFDLDKSPTKYYSAPMKPNEAYLFDMYVLKAFRGKNLAPILRYKMYQILKDLGCDTGYSVTECFNTPSLKFKEKLNAQYVLLGVYVSLFQKFRGRWVLKRY